MIRVMMEAHHKPSGQRKLRLKIFVIFFTQDDDNDDDEAPQAKWAEEAEAKDIFLFLSHRMMMRMMMKHITGHSAEEAEARDLSRFLHTGR